MNPFVLVSVALLYTTGAHSFIVAPCLTGTSQNGLIGSYKPQCTESGFFRALQVHGSTGAMWCVHPETGAKIGGFATSCPKCLVELENYHNGAQVIGRTKPSCDENGKYNLIQSSASSGYSWCANPETGEKIPGTEKAPGLLGRANCAAFAASIANNVVIAPCFVEREAKLSKPLLGQNVPECEDDGTYKQYQTSASTGYTWCVNTKTGEKIPGTDRAPGMLGLPNCAAASGINQNFVVAPCFVEREAKLNKGPMPGMFVPQCEDDGTYKQYQSSGSTGYTWCVNTKTGEKIPGTDRAPGMLGLPNCAAASGINQNFVVAPCFVEREAKLSKPLLGQTVPECEDNGKYKPIQSSASSGYSWCVNTETGEKIPGTEKAPGLLGRPNCAAFTPGNENFVVAPCFVEKANIESKPMLLGQFVPSCDNSGFYNSIQFHEGHRFCVNTNTGKQLPGSPSLKVGEVGFLPCEN